MYWFCHTSTWIRMDVHVFPILNPPPTSLPGPSLWVIPVHQPQASYILHWNWTGDLFLIWYYMDFPGGSDGKVSVYNVRDLGSIPGLGRLPGEGNGNPLQYYCLENPMDGGAWCRLLCFNAILPNHPTLSLSHRVQKTVLYICVSFAVSHTGLSLPSF